MDELDEIKKKKMEKLLKRQEMPSSPVKVTDSSLDQVIQRYPLVLVDFWAEWCTPCKMIAPVVEELAREYQGKLVCAKLNVDENRAAAMRFQTLSIPTLLLFKEGRLVERITGALPKPYLEARIKPHLSTDR
jgi:thioredoxin 1